MERRKRRKRLQCPANHGQIAPGYRPADVIARGGGSLPNRILCSVSHCRMPMRKSIIGHVGDTSFSEALRLIEELSARVTLFVHNATAEKVLHFSEELVL